MIYGIDANSKSVGVTWWDGIEYEFRKMDVWDKWSIEAAPWFRKIMDRFFWRYNLCEDDAVFVEAPVVAGARNIQSTVKQAYINGIIQASVGVRNATCVLVSPSTWKQTAAGGGRASKEEVAQHVDLTLQETHPHFAARLQAANDQDLYDATAICLHGRSLRFGVDG